ELFRDLGERADAHVLERGQIDALYLLRWGCAIAALGGRLGRLSLLRGCGLRLFARLSISFHRSSSPSPVTAETRSTECQNTVSRSLVARIRWPRASLSILVATRAACSATVVSHRHASTSLSSPGWRASTSSNAAVATPIPRVKYASASSANSRAAW